MGSLGPKTSYLPVNAFHLAYDLTHLIDPVTHTLRKEINDSLIMTQSSDSDGEFACIRISVAYAEPIDETWVQTIFGILYSTVFLISLVGNGMIFYSVCCRRIQFTVRRVFVLSLACSDLLIGIFSLPITGISLFKRSWIFGDIACRGISVVQGGGIFISSFTLAAIAIDRYFLIVHSTGRQFLTDPLATVIVICIWVASWVFVSPSAVFSTLESYNVTINNTRMPLCGQYCEEHWPNTDASAAIRPIYGMFITIAQYAVPCTITAFCYIAIALQVRNQIRLRHTHEIILPEAEKKLLTRRRRTNRMTTLMVCSFMFAWFPMNLLNLTRDFGGVRPGSFLETNFSVLFATAHLCGMTSTIWNPVIYSWFQSPFRSLFPCLSKCWRSRQRHSIRNGHVDERHGADPGEGDNCELLKKDGAR